MTFLPHSAPALTAAIILIAALSGWSCARYYAAPRERKLPRLTTPTERAALKENKA